MQEARVRIASFPRWISITDKLLSEFRHDVPTAGAILCRWVLAHRSAQYGCLETVAYALLQSVLICVLCFRR